MASGTSASATLRARRAAAAALSDPRRFTLAISSAVGADTVTGRLPRLGDRAGRGALSVCFLHELQIRRSRKEPGPGVPSLARVISRGYRAA